MAETKEECKANGGIGKYSPDICCYCRDLPTCEVAKKGEQEYIIKQKEKQVLKKELAKKRLGGRKIKDNDLVCMYCGSKPKKCPCKNKPQARFELRTGISRAKL